MAVCVDATIFKEKTAHNDKMAQSESLCVGVYQINNHCKWLKIVILNQIPLRWEGKNGGAPLGGNPNVERVASRLGGGKRGALEPLLS